MTSAGTPSQTVGPFFSFGLCERPTSELVAPDAPEALRLTGAVLDGEDVPVPDAMVEVWDAHAGWGRCGTNEEGRYAFVLAKPRARGDQAPHLSVLVFARGLLKPVFTRVYFPDESEANDRDPLLAALAPEERDALVARAAGDDLRFDVHLQGAHQTPFFVL